MDIYGLGVPDLTEETAMYCCNCNELRSAEDDECPVCGDGLQAVDKCPSCNGLKCVDVPVCTECAEKINTEFTKIARKFLFDDNEEFLEVINEVLL